MCSSAVTVNLWRRRRKYMIILKIKCNEVRGSSSLSWWVLLVVVFRLVMVVMSFPYIGLKHKIGFCCFTKFLPFTKLQLIHLSLYIILEAKVPLNDILLYSASSSVSYSPLQALLRPSESK